MLDWPSYRGYIIETYTSWVGQRDDLFGLIFDESLFCKYKMNNLSPLIIKQMKHMGSTLSNREVVVPQEAAVSQEAVVLQEVAVLWVAVDMQEPGVEDVGCIAEAHITLSVGEAIPHSFHLHFTHTNYLLPPSNVISVWTPTTTRTIKVVQGGWCSMNRGSGSTRLLAMELSASPSILA